MWASCGRRGAASVAAMRRSCAAYQRTVSSLTSTSEEQRPRRRPFPVLPQVRKPFPPPTEDFLRAKQEHLDLLRTCLAGGGERGIHRHVVKNKKVLVRDRIAAVLDDPDAFFELCPTAGMGLDYGDVPGAGLVCGVGRVEGVTCVVASSDGTVKGGTAFPITVTKIMRTFEMAKALALPTIHMADSGGAFLPLQSEIFPDKLHGGRQFRNQAVMSSRGLPQVSLVNGMCTAGGAYLPTMCDETVIVKGIGTIYLGGPPLVKAATGEQVTAEELGGATLHSGISGYVDHFAEDESESFDILRDIMVSLNRPEKDDGPVSYEPPMGAATARLEHVAGLKSIGREEVYLVISCLADGSRFREFKARFGCNLVTGFAFLKGRLVGFVGNCGPITAADAQKGAHFMELCDARDVPVVFLQNSSNSFGPDSEAADGVTLKERAKFAQHQSAVRVPKVTVNIGGCHGDEQFTMCGPSFRPRFNFSWPMATMFKSDPSAIPEEHLKTKQSSRSEYHFAAGSAQFWASRVATDGVLLPGETRDELARCLGLAMLHHVPNAGVRAAGRMVARM